MKNLTFLTIAIITLGLAPANNVLRAKIKAEWTKPGYTNRAYSKIAVIGIGQDLRARIAFETEAVNRLKKKGINAVLGSSIFPVIIEEEMEKDRLIQILTENKLDGVITMSLVKTDQTIDYIPGQIYTVTTGYYRFRRHIYRRYQTMRTPGYMIDRKTYLIEANLFDLKGDLSEDSDTLVWKGQSSLVNPSSRKGAAKSFAKPMVKHLIKKGIVKPKVTG